ncbi:MAG: metal-sensitive transcriptional regulator [Candidatus Pacebacteria bacterium]|nr:metal-sensitive transcriptional regulator [Candidatus Paceibacterota bacterium]
MEKKNRKNTLVQRLNIIKGQIEALSSYIDDKKDCKKVITQLSAVNSGLKKVTELYLKENLNSCVKSIKTKDKEKIDLLLKEIIKNK